MREIEDRYREEFIGEYPKVKRHPEFYIEKLHEETNELHPYSDPEMPVSEAELDEVADILFTWFGYLNSRGISLGDALDRADHKLDELIVRAAYASEQPDFRTGWDVKKWFPDG